MVKLLAEDLDFGTHPQQTSKAKILLEIEKLGPEANINPELIEKENKEEMTRKNRDFIEIIERAEIFGWKMRSKLGQRKDGIILWSVRKPWWIWNMGSYAQRKGINAYFEAKS